MKYTWQAARIIFPSLLNVQNVAGVFLAVIQEETNHQCTKDAVIFQERKPTQQYKVSCVALMK